MTIRIVQCHFVGMLAALCGLAMTASALAQQTPSNDDGQAIFADYYSTTKALRQEHMKLLADIDEQYAESLQRYRDENVQRAQALPDLYRAAHKDLATKNLTGAEKQEEFERIQAEDKKRRLEHATWRDDTARALRDQYAAARSAEISRHQAELDRLLADRNAKLGGIRALDGKIGLTPGATAAVDSANADTGVTALQQTSGVPGGTTNDVVGTAGTTSSAGNSLPGTMTPPTGLPPATNPAAGTVPLDMPADGIIDDRQDAAGAIIEQGETRPVEDDYRSLDYESTIVMCPAAYGYELSYPVPEPWTPSFKSVKGEDQRPLTEVKFIHGYGTSMVCHYCTSCDLETNWFYLHAPVPEGQVCRGLGSGRFECRKEGTVIQMSGEVTLGPSQRAALQRWAGNSIWWRSDSETAQYLEMLESSRIKKVSRGADPEYWSCVDALENGSEQRYASANVNVGDTFCYKLAGFGRYGWLRITDEERGRGRTIVFRFETWTSERDRR